MTLDFFQVFRYLSGLAVSQLLACLSIIPSLLFIDRETLSYGFAFYYAHFELLLVNTPTASCVYILVVIQFYSQVYIIFG